MNLLVTTFGSREEFERGRALMDDLEIPYELLSPDPGFRLVGVPGLVTAAESRQALSRLGKDGFLCAGWVDYRPASVPVPETEPPFAEQGIFGEAAISVLAPCVADQSKIRLIAQVTGDLSSAMPYLNAEMERASFNPRVPVLTFMDGHRMVALHPRRVTVAKADELVDAWRTLEGVRRLVESVWARRQEIEPNYLTRERPPALEIFKRLPGTNCKVCGEPTCLAFAVKVWSGEAAVTECTPVFGHRAVRAELRGALEEVCAALGV